MSRTARASHAKRSTNSAPRIFVLWVLVLLALGGVSLLLLNQNIGSGPIKEPSSEPKKGGRLIVEDKPKKEELTFYQTLTDHPDKKSAVVDLKTRKAIQNPPKAGNLQPAQAQANQANNPVSKRYTLQVGSFAEKESAQKLVGKLTGNGYLAYQVQAIVAGGETRYRVRVGSFVDKIQAKSMAQRLESEEGLKSFIAFLEKGSQ